MSQSLINQGNILTFSKNEWQFIFYEELSQSLINQGNILTRLTRDDFEIIEMI